MSRLKIAKGNLRPRPARQLLPAHAHRYLEHFDTLIERDAISLSTVMASPDFPHPYWDPILRRDK
eukprot:8628883-Lingulodinium_polyedra.AAC.1